MSQFDAFMKGNVKPNDETAEVKLERFSEPFVLMPMTVGMAKECRADANKVITDGKGNMKETLDSENYNDALIINTVVCPNFNNAELQNSYGVKSAKALLNVMFTQKEYLELFNEAVKINSKQDETPVEKAKN